MSIITLGIYGLYWYYAVNKELEVSGQKVAPVMSLLAITFGVILVIPPFVSLYNTADRIRRAQEHQGDDQPDLPGAGPRDGLHPDRELLPHRVPAEQPQQRVGARLDGQLTP